MAPAIENLKQLEELLAGEGEGGLLVCYETAGTSPMPPLPTGFILSIRTRTA